MDLTNKEVKEIQKDTSPADAESKQIVETNKWFVFSALLLFVVIVLIFMNFNLQNAANKPPETRWLKMSPDGSWAVDVKPPNSYQEYYTTTIDKLLSDYIGYRFQEIPQTIRSDYGKALIFQDIKLQRWFKAEDGFNAIGKAGEISTSTNGMTKKVKLLFFDHKESLTGIFNGGKNKSQIVNSTAYIEEIFIDKYGISNSDPIRKVINISWMIQAAKDIRDKETQYFRVNPIGILILTERENIDRAYN
jgi:hypothetical protein